MYLNEYIDARKAALKDRVTANTDALSKIITSAKLEELLMMEGYILRSIRDEEAQGTNEETNDSEDKGDDEN